MRTLLIILALLPSLAKAEHMGHELPTTHGMVLLGKDKIFLSHLPMFHAPHDQQVIFSVEIDTRSKAQLDASDADLFTLVPEEFKLGEMIKNPHDFEAEIYAGHFERGGKLIAEHVKVSNVQVLFQKKLLAETPRPKMASYYAFGEFGGIQYLAHVIHGKPDFDQLVEIESKFPGKGFVRFLGILDSQPLEAGMQLRDTHGSEWKIKKVIYTEFGDLAH